ncbi:hypothetical protein HMI55_006330 [Coelomomyces lativittatus]|nr:hypothetical protein HMI55_006330 [Coelomomyces lativittatus]
MKQAYYEHVQHFRTTLESVLEMHANEIHSLFHNAQTALETKLAEWHSQLEHWVTHYHTFSHTTLHSYIQDYDAFMLEQCDIPLACEDQLQRLHENTAHFLSSQLEAYYTNTETMLVPKSFLLLQGTAVALDISDTLLQEYQTSLERVGILKKILTVFHEQWNTTLHSLSNTWSESHTQFILTTFQPEFSATDQFHLANQLTPLLLTTTFMNYNDLSVLQNKIQNEFQNAFKSWSSSMTQQVHAFIKSSGSDSLGEILKAKVPWKKTEQWLNQLAKDLIAYLQHYWTKFQVLKSSQHILHQILTFQQFQFSSTFEKDQYLLNECTSNYQTDVQLLEKEIEMLNSKLKKGKSELECMQVIQEVKSNAVKLERKHEFYVKEYQALLNKLHSKHTEHFKLFEMFWVSLDLSSDMPKDFTLFFQKLLDYVKTSQVPVQESLRPTRWNDPLPSTTLLHQFFQSKLESTQNDLDQHWHLNATSTWQMAMHSQMLFEQWQGDTLSQLHLTRTSQLRHLTNQLNERLYFHSFTKENDAKHGHHRVLELQRQHVQTRNELQQWTEDHQRHHLTWTTTMKTIEKELQSFLVQLQGGDGLSSSLGTSTEIQQRQRRLHQNSENAIKKSQDQLAALQKNICAFEEQVRPTQYYSFLEPNLKESHACFTEGQNETTKLESKIKEVTASLIQDLDGIHKELSRVQEIYQQFTKVKLEIKSLVLSYQFKFRGFLNTWNKRVESITLSTWDALPEAMAVLWVVMKEIQAEAVRIDLPVHPLPKSMPFVTFEYFKKEHFTTISSHSKKTLFENSKAEIIKKNSQDKNYTLIFESLLPTSAKVPDALAALYLEAQLLDKKDDGNDEKNPKKHTSNQTQWLEDLDTKLMGLMDAWTFKKALPSPMSKTSMQLDGLAVRAVAYTIYQEIKEYMNQSIPLLQQELRQCIHRVENKFTTFLKTNFIEWEKALVSSHLALQTRWQQGLDDLLDQSNQIQKTWKIMLPNDHDQHNEESLEKAIDLWFQAIEQWYLSSQNELNTFITQSPILLHFCLETVAPLTWFMSSTPFPNDTMFSTLPIKHGFSNHPLSTWIWEWCQKVTGKLDYLHQKVSESFKSQKEHSENKQKEWKVSWDLAMELVRNQTY